MTVDPENNERPDHQTEAKGIQYLIQQRALAALEREKAGRSRSPRHVALIILAAFVMLCALLELINVGVRVTHRIIDIWVPVLMSPKKSDANPQRPYPVTVEPSAAQSQSSNSQASQSPHH